MKISENEAIVKRLNDQIAQLRADGENWQKKIREAENKTR